MIRWSAKRCATAAAAGADAAVAVAAVVPVYGLNPHRSSAGNGGVVDSLKRGTVLISSTC